MAAKLYFGTQQTFLTRLECVFCAGCVLCFWCVCSHHISRQLNPSLIADWLVCSSHFKYLRFAFTTRHLEAVKCIYSRRVSQFTMCLCSCLCLYKLCLLFSGRVHFFLPMTLLAKEALFSVAKPRSPIFTEPVGPVIKMLSHFRSLWMMGGVLVCRKWRPLRICLHHERRTLIFITLKRFR